MAQRKAKLPIFKAKKEIVSQFIKPLGYPEKGKPALLF